MSPISEEPLPDFNLSIPDDALALMERFEGEWNNGGLFQLFSNWNRVDIVLIPEGLRMIGAHVMAPIVEAAIAETAAGTKWSDSSLFNYSKAPKELSDRFWELDGQLLPHADSLTALIADYEKNLHEDSEDFFGEGEKET